MHISESQVAVRYKDTDQMGVVHHSNYVVWCEIGRTDFIKELGYAYAQMEEDGILLPVTNVNVTYKSPAKYGDVVTIKTWIEEYNGIRLTFGYDIISPTGKVCVTAQTTHVCVKKDTFKPISIRKTLPEWDKVYVGAMKKTDE